MNDTPKNTYCNGLGEQWPWWIQVTGDGLIELGDLAFEFALGEDWYADEKTFGQSDLHAAACKLHDEIVRRDMAHRAAVVADGLRTLLAAAADGDRPVFTPDEVARGTLVDLVEIVIGQRAEYREDAVRRRDELAQAREQIAALEGQLQAARTAKDYAESCIDGAKEESYRRVKAAHAERDAALARVAAPEAELSEARAKIAELQTNIVDAREPKDG